MYTPRTLFSSRFLQICRFILSLFITGRLATVPCEITVQSPMSDGKVWSVFEFFTRDAGRALGLGFDPTGNDAV